MRSSRTLPAVIVFVLTLGVLLPLAYSSSVHGDEVMEAWSAAYYGGRLARLDLSPNAGDLQLDPGWSPYSPWAQTQPMGARFIYALVLGISGAPPAPYGDDGSHVAFETLFPMRVAAILSAALGLALIALRLRWPALAAVVLFLAIPHVREDLARGWGEGPLLLGFGLCAVSYGSRWFPAACGFAATLKLTALGIWPFMYLPGAVGRWSRLRVLGPVAIACLVWSAATPPAWFAGGPPFLVAMILYRGREYGEQSGLVGGPFGLFVPSRYVWPVELAALLALCVLAPRLWHRLRSSGDPRAEVG